MYKIAVWRRAWALSSAVVVSGGSFAYRDEIKLLIQTNHGFYDACSEEWLGYL